MLNALSARGDAQAGDLDIHPVLVSGIAQ